jgi:DNA-binding transcriptional LysR family regulator
MDIRQIQYFLSIVDTGSFSAAADEHYISQSSLSKKIIALEKELGISLFDRSKRKVFLTDAGKAFRAHARKIDAVYKDIIVDLNGYKTETDSFSIAAIPIITQYGITAYFARFQDLYPDIHFTLEEVHGLNIFPALEEHRFDVAITRHNYLDHEKFESFEIYKDKLLAIVSQKNRLAGRSSVSIKELSAENFIVFDKVTDLHQLIMDECKKAGFEPTIFYSSHRKVSVFGLVGANIGMALLPSKIYEYHKHPDVLPIPLEEDIETNVILAYLKNNKLPRSAEIFIDFLEKALTEEQGEQE